jgi:hypothetical protein
MIYILASFSFLYFLRSHRTGEWCIPQQPILAKKHYSNFVMTTQPSMSLSGDGVPSEMIMIQYTRPRNWNVNISVFSLQTDFARNRIQVLWAFFLIKYISFPYSPIHRKQQRERGCGVGVIRRRRTGSSVSCMVHCV